MDRNGQTLQSLGRRGSFLDSFGWMDNNTFVYRDHWGGSNKLVHILEISTNVELANAYIHAAEINAITPDLIITDNGMQTEGPYSAAVIATQIFNPDDVLRSHIKNLSTNDHAPYLFNSRVVDTVLNRNQVLVRTWDASEYLTDTLHTPVDLQLWDPQTDELTMLIPGSYTGRITPDGQYLAALIPESEFPQLQLSNQFTGQVIFMRPAYDGKLSFSPNGRYFTFFTPETDLIIYDLETGEMLPPITAVPALPIWSPDSARFVYTDPTLGLSIYDTRNNTTFPLAESGGERLSNPQWSFDGAYLSVVTKIGEVGEWEWQTAVLAPLDNTTGQLDNGTVTEPFWRQAMVTITVKNIPDDLYADLKRAAANNRRSINSEIIVSIEQAVRSTRTDPDELLEKIRVLREATARYTLTDEILDQTINEGRP